MKGGIRLSYSKVRLVSLSVSVRSSLMEESSRIHWEFGRGVSPMDLQDLSRLSKEQVPTRLSYSTTTQQPTLLSAAPPNQSSDQLHSPQPSALPLPLNYDLPQTSLRRINSLAPSPLSAQPTNPEPHLHTHDDIHVHSQSLNPIPRARSSHSHYFLVSRSVFSIFITPFPPFPHASL